MSSYSRWGPPPPPRGGRRMFNIFGLLIPAPIVAVIGATLLATTLGAVMGRSGFSLHQYLVLLPAKVFHGELWRLLAWPLIEPNVLNLVFGSMLLYFVGPEVLSRWGTRRFVLFYFGGAVVTGALVCGLGYFWTRVYLTPYFGMWPMIEGLIIVWASMFPDRAIRVYLILPLAGRHLIAFTIAITIVFGLVDGFNWYLPHYFAQLIALVYMDVFSLRRRYLGWRMTMLQREQKRRANSPLRAVDRDEPPRWTH